MGPFTLPCKTPGLDRISPPLLSTPPQASANRVSVGPAFQVLTCFLHAWGSPR